ncbi:MAG TPA: ATP-binding protein [Dehalococcoidales bacterium]|nr:ATP-binding protein [Dehalococcoidales bacterium]
MSNNMPTENGQPVNSPKDRGKPNLAMLLIIFIVIAVIGTGGFLFFSAQKEAERQSVETELQSIAQLKAGQIEQWRAERLGNARASAKSQYFVLNAQRLIQNPDDPALNAEIIREMAGMALNYPYKDLLLVNSSGKVLASLKSHPTLLPEVYRTQLAVALSENQPAWVDFHISSIGQEPELGLIAPLAVENSASQRNTGAIIFMIDPAFYLYPALQKWPDDGNSAEAMLIEKRETEVKYLNALRFKQGAVVSLAAVPVESEKELVAAIRGTRGVVTGADYRGVESLAVFERIADSDWYVVAKIDESEIYSGWNIHLTLVIVMTLILLTLLMAIAVYAWQKRQQRAFESLSQKNSEHLSLLKQFENIVKYANDIILITDAQRKIVQVNERALEAYGYSQVEITGMDLISLVPENEMSTFESILNIIRDKGAVTTDMKHRRRDGSAFPVELSARVFKIDERPYLQAIIRDISERKIKEEEIRQLNASLEARKEDRTAELEHVNKELEALAYSVSHDLRAPLRDIVSLSQNLEEESKDKLSPKGLSLLARIRSEAKRMGQLFDDILKFSRDTRGELKVEETDISALVGIISARLQQSRPDRSIKFVTQEGLKAQCDRRLIEVALTNLLDNAVKFTAKNEKTLILVGKIQQQGKEVFFVRDNGVGFDMAFASKLFKVFQRLHNDSDYPGTGTGLAIVQKIINRHGGRIWVESRPDQGATFYFTLKDR